MGQIKITWTKSCIGRTQGQRRVIESLGLKRLNHTVTLGDTPTIRGMVNKVQHLLAVEQIEEPQKPARRRTRKATATSEASLEEATTSQESLDETDIAESPAS